MRTIVDISDDDISHLDRIGKRDNLSRAEIMRRAVGLYLEEERKRKSDAALETYYGFLKDVPNAFDGLDGLAYQDKMRGEWDDRDNMYRTWGFHDSDAQTPYSAKTNTNKDDEAEL